MTTYSDYYQCKDALEDIMPSKRDITNKLLPNLVRTKAEELRLVTLGALAELNEQGWEDDE